MNASNIVITAVILSTLSGCYEEQDTGSGSNTPISGIALDGPIARAVIFVDINNNSTLDALEPRALTDNDGRFSTAADGTNYCALANSHANSVYCLRTPPTTDAEVSLRITRGYDTLSSTQYYGTITRAIGAVDGTTPVATPITSLYAQMNPTTRANFLLAENITESELNFTNYLDFDTEPATQQTLSRLAIMLQKAVDVIGHSIEGAYTNWGSVVDLEDDTVATVPENPADVIYNALADAFEARYAATSGVLPTATEILQNTTSVQSAIDASVAAVQDMNGVDATGAAVPSNLAARITQLADMVERKFETSIPSLSQFRGVIGTIDVAVISMRKFSYNPSSEMALLVTSTLADNPSYEEKLRDDAVDLDDLAARIESGDVDSASEVDYTNRTPIADVTNKVLKIIENDTSENAETTERDNVQLVFNPPTSSDGSQSVDNGTLTAVLDLSSDARKEFNLDQGEEVSGTWSRLNDYSFLLNVDVAGTTQPIIMKRSANGEGYTFDFGGNLADYTPNENCDLASAAACSGN